MQQKTPLSTPWKKKLKSNEAKENQKRTDEPNGGSGFL